MACLVFWFVPMKTLDTGHILFCSTTYLVVLLFNILVSEDKRAQAQLSKVLNIVEGLVNNSLFSLVNMVALLQPWEDHIVLFEIK